MIFAFRLRSWSRDPVRDQRVIHALVNAMAEINAPLVASGRYPRLYESGVRYKEERAAEGERIEIFRDIPDILKNGGSDCNNLCAWRVAELRHAHIPCDVCIVWDGDLKSGFTYHAYIQLQGTREDPSILLGM